MIIKGAMICDAKQEQRGDVRIEGGKITKVARSILPNAEEEILNAEGMILLPGAIDLNIRVKDSQLTKNNLVELSNKAAKGGVTLGVLMPDCYPALSTEMGVELLNALKEDFKAKIIPAVASCGEKLSSGNYGINELSTLYKKGACAIYTQSSEEGNILKRASEFSLMLKMPMFFACEDESLSANGVMNDGELSWRLGLPAISTLSETKEVAKISEVVCFMGVKSVFLSVSADRSMEILLEAKRKNKDIFIQTSIHHLMLTENLCNGYNSAAKIKPPLKSEETRQKFVKRLKKGEIDLITSLQSESSLSKKDLAFDEASFGVDMIEHYYSLCYSALVKEMHLSLQEMSKIISYNPALVLGVEKNKGLIEVGYDADLVLLDPKESEVISEVSSPYYDWILNGKVKKVFIDGEIL
ncbi:dihydroorotase [Helicobacter valdiviensis]|uniref:Dihydroorotase n=1 Tax=Helicobacter valdiviensis TaxID=1458358 RepID=A0A2W6MVM2_9HELI|nr:amidohydrolase family protein [Helicobacter valdiviensis]PZT48467.1 dihydroorotase [Helicobacter valdiviensis]